MSKREQRREQGSGWQNAVNSMTLEEAGRLGYGLNLDEDDFVPSSPSNAIVPAEDGEFLYKRFRLKPTGIIIPDNLQEDEWLDIFKLLRKLNEAIQWSVGDLVNHAERSWGTTYTEMANITGYSEKTLRDYAYVARSVHLSMRIDNLSFSHHQQVAGMKDPLTGEPLTEEQTRWLEKAYENGWSSKRLREEINATRQLPQTDADSNYFFDDNRVPKINRQLEILWVKARNGDAKARSEFLGSVNDIRQWLNDVVDSLDD